MKRFFPIRKSLFNLIILSSTACSQPAVFHAEFPFDTTYLGKSVPLDKYQKSVLDWVWYINGSRMTWRSGSIRIAIDSAGIDTLLLVKSHKKSDTIFCRITHPYRYIIRFNPCCEGINIEKEKGIYFQPILDIQGDTNCRNILLGKLNNTIKQINRRGITRLARICPHSAMESNIVDFSILRGRRNLYGHDCYMDSDDALPRQYGRTVLHFKYVALDTMPITVMYDAGNNRIAFK